MELEQLQAFLSEVDPNRIFKINFDSTLSVFFDLDTPFNYEEHINETTGMLVVKGYTDLHGNEYDLHVAIRAIQDIIVVNEESDKEYMSKRMLAH